MKRFSRKNNKAGFTLVETLIAISILVLVTIGVTNGVQRALSSYFFSKDQVIAFYLAQEGFEQIRNIRDVNRINSRDWLFGIALADTDPCAFGQACTVSPTETTAAIRCTTPSSCSTLRMSPTQGLYSYNTSWALTPFVRQITLTPVTVDEVAVTVTISWSKGDSTRQFRARENLFNWQ